MERDELEAELSILLTELEGQPEDAHEIYLRLRQLIASMRAFGMAIPEDLVELESRLDSEFAADKKAGGRRRRHNLRRNEGES